MSEEGKRNYDLEERTFIFAQGVRVFVKLLKLTISNQEDIRQLVRASGSVGANYIEANESLSKKDFIYRVKICRKEAKESGFFLKLLDLNEDSFLEIEKNKLLNESVELMKIFGAIIQKSSD